MSTTSTSPAAELEKILGAAQLPALPQSAVKILELSRDADNGPAEFAVPIEADPGLTGQVLRFVNSSYFGFSREISNVKHAITLVGVRTIKNFSLWSAVFSLMPNPRCGSFDLKNLWQDSLRRGLFARTMGKLVGMREAEELFAASLLQDMAVPLLSKERPQMYQEMLAGRQGGERRLSELERERFGWTHADAAAFMTRKWNFPEEFAVLVERHADLEALANEGAPPPNQVVAHSALLPATGDACWHDAAAFEQHYNRLCLAGGPTSTETLAKIDREFAEFAPVLKIAAPAKTLVELQQAAAASA